MELSFMTVGGLCGSVDLDAPAPVIDLSDVSFLRPFGLVYLGMFLRHHCAQGTSMRVVLPRSSMARGYMSGQRFWERFNFGPGTIAREQLMGFSPGTALNDMIDIQNSHYVAEEIAEAVVGVLTRSDANVQLGVIAEVVAELVDNFAVHSGTELAVFAMQYYPRLHEIALAVGDCGSGMRATLARNRTYGYLAERPHREAITKAFEPSVSCRSAGGMGLAEVRQRVRELGGTIRVASHDGYAVLLPQETRIGNMRSTLQGVQVEVSLPEGGSR